MKDESKEKVTNTEKSKENDVQNNETKKKKERAVKDNSEQKSSTVRKILSITWKLIVKLVTLAILLISIIIITQKVTNNEQAFLGYRIFRVQTGSMIPKYQIGDVILVKEKDPDKIKVGDDVTYQGLEGTVKGLLITHRVIDIEMVDGVKTFHTQGIANNQEDPVIHGEQINGVVQFRMTILTLICKMLNNKYIFYFCGILPLTIYVFFKAIKGTKESYLKKIEKDN